MSEQDVQHVLRCQLCNKPFDKQSALKRHVYYCRSRSTGGSVRARSCLSCAKRKARCDNKLPKCSRCLTQAIECQYPAKALRASGQRTQPPQSALNFEDTTPYPPSPNIPRLGASDESSSYSQGLLDAGLAISDTSFADFKGINLEWDEPVVDLTDLWDSQMIENVSKDTMTSGSSLLQLHTPPEDEPSNLLQRHPLLRPSIPAAPTTAVHSILVRPGTKAGRQKSASLMLHSLKSYARMILRENILPPFIHPSFSLLSDARDDAMEPLNNCIAIVHMMSIGTKSSTKLFWKNVRLECERWSSERSDLDRWGLIAALQAVIVYILIRISEGETEENKLDSLLLSTITVLSTEITRLDLFHYGSITVRDSNPEQIWQDWIWEETARRICIIVQSMNMLVYFDPAYMCTLQPDLVLAPLPAKKQLWEAGNMGEWKAETEKVSVLDPVFALTTNGDLVKIADSNGHPFDSAARKRLTGTVCSTRIPADWEEWCTGMDGLGSLVTLAASLTTLP